jgi:hypothetical protein
LCQEPGVTSAAMRVDVCYKTSKCVRQISKRTQADRASVGANQRCLDEFTSWDGAGIDEVDGVVSNRLEVWKDRTL